MASVVIHLGYYFALSEAYRRADMGQIYPIARGAAPLLTASATVGLLHEPLSWQSAAGIAVLSVPGLDPTFLKARTTTLGQWPADADGPLTPFMRYLLASDA